MSKPRVFVTRSVPDVGIKLLEEDCSVETWQKEDPVPRETLLRCVKDVSGLFCTVGDSINKEVLDAAGPSLKVVATMSVGTDNIDVAECHRRCIQVCPTPAIATDCAADIAVALILMTTRRLVEGIDAFRSGDWTGWKPTWLCGSGLISKTVGVLGFGRVGFGIARRMKPFGIDRIIYNDIQEVEFARGIADFVTRDELFSVSDIICICCPVTPQTSGLVNKTMLQKMKPTSVLINTSRGVLVNQDDLVDALKNNTIAAAGLDVTNPEPLPQNHPLRSLSNCVILPHMGTNTVEARESMSINTAKNILAVLGLKH